MLKARDFRYQAWNQLRGKWGIMALTTLIMQAIMGVCGGLVYVGIGAIAFLIITGPLTVGYAILSLQIIRGADVRVETLFSGFKMFERSFVLSLINTILIALWSLLFVIPGIIKAYSYSMSYYILIDNPNLSANEARKLSMEMMRGNKWRLFCLELSFIGWFLLSAITFGILSFWVTPYYNAAIAAFYQSLVAEREQRGDRQPLYNYGQQPNGAPSEPAPEASHEDPFEPDSNKF